MFDLRSIPDLDGALCTQVGGDIFFPEGQGASARPGKLICSRCPVRQECLDWALDHKVREGIWGGLTERERRKLIKERAA